MSAQSGTAATRGRRVSEPRVTLITTAKNEGRFLLEWFAYMRHVGATDILIYTNDCEDDSPAMLDRLTEMGIVTHVPNPCGPNDFPHRKALRRARNHPLVKEAEYLMVMDPDEFLVIHAGNHRYADLIATAPEADVICVQMRFFGDNGIATLPQGLVIEHFTGASEQDYEMNRMIKSLVKNSDRFTDVVKNHLPIFEEDNPPRIFNGGGVEVPPDAYRHKFFFNIPRRFRSMQNAQLNHYAIKSFDHYKAKVYRGEAAPPVAKLHMGYWNERNKNDVQDTAILREVPAVKALLAEWLKDPELDKLNKRCFEAFDAILKKTAELDVEEAPQ